MTPGLIERLEAAGEGSRELDADIYEALGFEVKRRPEWYGGRRYSRGWAFFRNSRWEAMAHLTVSLDDGLALAARLLGEVMWQAGFDPDAGDFTARLAIPTGPDVQHARGSAATAPLSLCIAILKARATQEQG